jgi:trigger factor
MQISVETIEGLKRRMTVELPAESFEEAVNKRYRSLAKTTRVHGFRPGKVPLGVIKNRFGKQVRQEVIGEAVQNGLLEALRQENLHPAGNPEVDVMPLEEGKGPKFTATFEVYPEIELASLDGVKIEKPVAQITDEDVENTLNVIQLQHTQLTQVERPAREGDTLIVDFKGTLDGKPFPGGTASKIPVKLGSQEFIEDFERNLAGMKTGEQKTFDATFPEDYKQEDLAGKTVQFEVSVFSVSEPHVPPIDEEFARNFGVEGGVEALRAEARENMQREMDQIIRETVKRQVMDALVEKHPMTLPQSLIDNEIQVLMQRTRASMQQYGSADDSRLKPEMFEEQARRRVALGLILSEIIQQQGFKAQPDKVRAAVENIASTYEQPDEVINWYYADKLRLNEIEAMVVEDEVVDWVLNNVQLVENSTTFNDIVRPPAKG